MCHIASIHSPPLVLGLFYKQAVPSCSCTRMLTQDAELGLPVSRRTNLYQTTSLRYVVLTTLSRLNSFLGGSSVS